MRTVGGVVAALVLVMVTATPAAAYPRPGSIERVSVRTDGGQANADSRPASISADGRFVAFHSYASNLVPDDVNQASDVFVHDRRAGVTERVSVGIDGDEASGGSLSSSLSATGRYVAFESAASNLVPGDTNETWDIFVRDRETGVTERVSVASDGTEGTVRPEERNLAVSGQSHSPSISASGRYVTFYSYASNLVPDDANRAPDVFVHDRETGVTERVSVATDGTEGDGGSSSPAVSADGRFVVFWSAASNLVPTDTNDRSDVFVRDREARVTERVSLGSGAAEANGHCYAASISADGRYVAFESWASNLVPADTNQAPDVFVRDRQSDTTERVSVGTNGAEAGDYTFSPAVSADGRYIAFYSWASNLVPGDTNGAPDVFVRDRLGSATERVSLGAGGVEGSRSSASPSLSGAGRYVAFYSEAPNLVAGDTNGAWDVFVRDRGPAVGVGGLRARKAPGELVVSGWATFSEAPVASADDPGDDGRAGTDDLGAEIVGASVTSRTEQEDLLLRLELASLPHRNVDECSPRVSGVAVCQQVHTGAAAPGVLYRFRFRLADTRYEVRALRAGATANPPQAPYFALYECSALDCDEVARVSGSIGTTAAEVTVSIPLAALQAGEGATLTRLAASTAVGEASPGSLIVLDDVWLPDAPIPVPQLELGIARASTPQSDVLFSTDGMLVDGRFAATLEVSSLPSGAYRVWARGCLNETCGVRSIPVTL